MRRFSCLCAMAAVAALATSASAADEYRSPLFPSTIAPLTVAQAQLAVSGETGNYPEFKGNVKTVETRDFWREAEISPRNQGFHYNQNAETYMLVGEALGRGMIELLAK